jgi:hypothetical protein
MLGAMLGSHSQCICGPESQFIEHLLARPDFDPHALDPRKTLAWIMADERYRLLWNMAVDPSTLNGTELGSTYPEVLTWLVQTYGRKLGKPAASVWIDQTPTNFKRGHTLLRMFPDARFIHLVRDGRAVAASLLRLDWGPNNVLHAAEFWMARCAPGLAAELELGSDRVLRVRYEDVVAEPESSLRRIAGFAGLEYEPTMVSGSGYRPNRYHERQHRLVGEPPDPSRLESWQQAFSPRELEIFEGEAGEFLEALGYQTRYGIRARPATRFEGLRLRLGDLARRTRNNLHRRWRARRSSE